MKTTREKADELVEQFKDYVNGYIGSSMLTNCEYPEQIERQATRVAILSVKHTIEVLEKAFNEQEGTKDIYSVAHYILEQTELLTELESRL